MSQELDCLFGNTCVFYSKKSDCRIKSSAEIGVCTPHIKKIAVVKNLAIEANASIEKAEAGLDELLSRPSNGFCKICGAPDTTVYMVNGSMEACAKCCISTVLPRRIMGTAHIALSPCAA